MEAHQQAMRALRQCEADLAAAQQAARGDGAAAVEARLRLPALEQQVLIAQARARELQTARTFARIDAKRRLAAAWQPAFLDAIKPLERKLLAARDDILALRALYAQFQEAAEGSEDEGLRGLWAYWDTPLTSGLDGWLAFLAQARAQARKG